ncbi:STAS domain-containing protein [Streptomyces sp. WAC01280]|uniref:STAS domain-containing protein n=1 Tax=Streptomyces sp. WAC01280 TaxID=2487424 RepID=UPI000F7A8267|nr:STAS domain-containing protein [Streptomyces sp. WAC01280]RSS55130.1 STAS domain-containing protein [Streptomyces sp. WAC01280]
MDISQPLVVTLPARPTRGEVALLCAELGAAPPGDVVCEVGALAHADLSAVDALARLRLAAGRRGHLIRFHGAGPELRALLRLTGLDETLGLQPDQAVDPTGP